MIILLLMSREKEDRKILVHVCCGPCATSSIKRLLDEGWSPVLFFSDSNIWPIEEFEKRYDTLLTVASFYNLDVIKDDYNHSEWREWVKGLENEPEHGKRCQNERNFCETDDCNVVFRTKRRRRKYFSFPGRS